MTKEYLKNLYEKYKPAIKETIDTVVFVVVAIIIIKFFIGEMGNICYNQT